MMFKEMITVYSESYKTHKYTGWENYRATNTSSKWHILPLCFKEVSKTLHNYVAFEFKMLPLKVNIKEEIMY